jgi:hypothetical protein
VIDLDELEARIAEGEKKNFFVAPLVKQLIAELREARGERAAVVAWLREEAEPSPQSFTVRGKEWAKRIDDIADFIERGEHRREEEP